MSASSSYEFKLGMYISETRLPFKESLELAHDLEVSYVWCGSYDEGRRISELPDAQVDEIAKLVDSYGLRLLFLDSGALFKQVHLAELERGKMLEHALFKEHFDQLMQSMEVASRLGIGAVSSSSFAWPAEYTAGKPTWPMRWATGGGIIADIDMEKLVEVKGRSHATLHSFRHTFNNTLRDLGLSMEDRNILMAQASSEVNKIYTHPNIELARKWINRIPSYDDHIKN